MRSDTIKRGFERAPHRSLLRATGQIRDEADFDKPFIAVCNSYVDIIPGHVHLQEFGRVVKEAVREAGGIPFEFNTIGVDDGIVMGHEGMRYSLPSRELIADCVETMVAAHCFDGMICIPNCDKIVPGMLMGAARVNIPTIFVSGGPMLAGRRRGGQQERPDHGLRGGRQARRRQDQRRAAAGSWSRSAARPAAVARGMFTANSMNCLCEALGIALPGNGTILGRSPERHELARTGRRAAASSWSRATSASATSSPPRRSTTPWRWTWRWADRPTPCCTCWRWRARPTSITRSPLQRGRRPRAAPGQGLPPGTASASGTSRTCTRPAASRRILAELAKKPGALNLDALTVTGKTLGENLAARREPQPRLPSARSRTRTRSAAR